MVIPLNGYVNWRFDVGSSTGAELGREQIALHMGVDEFRESFAFVVQHAVVAAGKEGDRVDLGLLEHIRKDLFVELATDISNQLTGVKVHVDLAHA
jgi:hypothetical protein